MPVGRLLCFIGIGILVIHLVGMRSGSKSGRREMVDGRSFLCNFRCNVLHCADWQINLPGPDVSSWVASYWRRINVVSFLLKKKKGAEHAIS